MKPGMCICAQKWNRDSDTSVNCPYVGEDPTVGLSARVQNSSQKIDFFSGVRFRFSHALMDQVP